MISVVDLSENAFLETVGDKETGWNDEVAGPEQKGCSLLEKMSVIPPIVRPSYINWETVISHTEDEHSANWLSMVYSLCYHPDLLQQNSARASTERVTKRAAKKDLRAVYQEGIEEIPESKLFASTDFLLSRLVGATDAVTLFDGVSDEIAPARLTQYKTRSNHLRADRRTDFRANYPLTTAELPCGYQIRFARFERKFCLFRRSPSN